MRKRDLGILLVSLFSVLISLRHEGSFSFREAWVHHAEDGGSPLKHASERLPPPIVVDLNGDGQSEVLVATRDSRLQVVQPVFLHGDEDFHEAKLLAEVSMLPAGVRVATGRQPVAMAAGYLDAPGVTSTVRRKAVIVVVTSGWSILCFDHNLKLLWENNVQEEFPHGAHLKEVAILIGNQSLRHGDRGAVIVGGSMEVIMQQYGELFEEEQDRETQAERHRRTAGEGEELEDVSGGKQERHFSYYAYEGGKGELRWKHDSKDFHRDASALSEQLLPQHNYKLDANALNSRHYGQVACHEYRHSVLGALPHKWERREDTRFELAHFRKQRRKSHKSVPGGSPPSIHAPLHKADAKWRAGQDSKNVVANVMGKALRAATGAKLVKKLAAEPVHANSSSYWWAPNAVVVHLKEGIEAVHLYSGRTICKVLLTAGGLHADMNGDGVVDHVQASGGFGGEQVAASGMRSPMQACWATATSGVPVREQLFNGSICKSETGTGMGVGVGEYMGSRAQRRQADAAAPLEVATAIILPRKDAHRHRKGSRGDAVFLNSLGDVTCFEAEGGLHSKTSHNGRVRWQVSTEAAWANHPSPAGIATERVVPTLEAMALRLGGPAEVILAIGQSGGVVLSPNGRQEAELSAPVDPVGTAVIVDFNDDGYNDIILPTTLGYYAYVQVRHPGALLFSSLLGFLIVALSVLGVTQSLAVPTGKRKGDRRSTD